MIYSLLADMVFWLHLFIVVFVLIGGLLVLRWEKLVWFHIPIAAWGIIVEWGNFTCPFTPLENYLSALAHRATYDISFTEKYLYPMLYIESFDRKLQLIFGLFVLVINLIIYGVIIKWRKAKDQGAGGFWQ